MFNEAKYIPINEVLEIIENAELEGRISPSAAEWIKFEIESAGDISRYKNPKYYK